MTEVTVEIRDIWVYLSTSPLLGLTLTLPTLAALIPADVTHTLQCYDEGIGDVPEDLDVDLDTELDGDVGFVGGLEDVAVQQV